MKRLPKTVWFFNYRWPSVSWRGVFCEVRGQENARVRSRASDLIDEIRAALAHGCATGLPIFVRIKWIKTN
jgi:hypothetical protein